MPTFELTTNGGSAYQIEADTPEQAQQAFSHVFGAPQADDGQMQGALRYPAMAGSNLAKGAAEGVGVIGDIQNLMQRGVNAPADWLAGLAGLTPSNKATTPPWGTPSESTETNSLLSSQNLVNAGKSLGIIDRPDLQPQNAGERFLAAGSEGAGGMLPASLLGGGGIGVNVARGLIQGAGAGLGGEGLAELFPDHPTLARLGGNILGAMGGATAFNVGNRLAGAVTGASTPMLDAYRNLGIEPKLAGDVTGNPTVQMIQAYAAKAPGGANRIHAASEQAVGQWGDALDRTAANYGASKTAQEAGAAVQMNANKWLTDWSAASRRAWANVDMHVPNATPVPTANYQATLGAVRSAMPNAPETADILQPSLSKNLLDALTKDTQSGPLTFQDVKGIRTRIGERLAEPQLVGDTSYADLKRLYGALSDDMANVIAQRGPAAQQAFDAATDLTRSGHGFVENVLSKVLRGDKITPEQAAANLLNTAGSGGTILNEVRQQMPQAADELAAYKLRDMGLANPGQQNASGARLSPGTFLTDANKLSPEASSALFANDPRINDLATVAGGMKNTERFLNTSNTGSHMATGHALGSALAAPVAMVEGYHLGGAPGAAAAAFGTLAMPYVPSYLAARATTSPMLASILSAPAAQLPSAALHNRAAIIPPALRALLGASGGLP